MKGRRPSVVGVVLLAAALVWSWSLDEIRARSARPVSFEGRYLLLAADRSGGDALMQEWLEVGNRHYRLHARGPIRAHPGQLVRVRGFLSNGRVDATSVEPVGPKPAHMVAGTKHGLTQRDGHPVDADRRATGLRPVGDKR